MTALRAADRERPAGGSAPQQQLRLWPADDAAAVRRWRTETAETAAAARRPNRQEQQELADADRGKVDAHSGRLRAPDGLHAGRLLSVWVIRCARADGLTWAALGILAVVGAWMAGNPDAANSRGVSGLAAELGRPLARVREHVRELERAGWLVVTRRPLRGTVVERTSMLSAGDRWRAAAETAAGAEALYPGRLLSLGAIRCARADGLTWAALGILAIVGAWMAGDPDAQPGRGRRDLLDVLGIEPGRSSSMSRPLRALRETGWLAGTSSGGWRAGGRWRAAAETAPASVDVAAAPQPAAPDDPARADRWGALTGCAICGAAVSCHPISGRPDPACSTCWAETPRQRRDDVMRQHRRDMAAWTAAPDPPPPPDCGECGQPAPHHAIWCQPRRSA